MLQIAYEALYFPPVINKQCISDFTAGRTESIPRGMGNAVCKLLEKGYSQLGSIDKNIKEKISNSCIKRLGIFWLVRLSVQGELSIKAEERFLPGC